jgi:hypothetical protein
MRRRLVISLLATTFVACSALAATAGASEIVTRNATHVSLKVDEKGYALVTYELGGTVKRALFWGAVDAKPPARGGRQVEFKKDYSGGWMTFKKKIWLTMKNTCRRYDGPTLPDLVVACKASDGSYWALQSWQRMLPNLGLAPWKASQSVWELHLSHWTGDVAQIDAHVDWSYHGRFHHLFGNYTYENQGVFGFASTSSGNPLDSFGRNMYLDTLNSAYGEGWLRENSFLAHQPNGSFCYGFYPHKPYPGYPAGDRPPGSGEQYRITAIGPGVTPDVMWTGADAGDWDAADQSKVELESSMNALQLSISGPDKLCRHE